MKAAVVAALALAAAVPAAGQPQSQAQDKVIDVRAGRPAAVNSFEALWAAQKKAENKGDLVAGQNTFREIRRLRIERNIRSLETLALARLADGMDALTAKDSEKASAYFADAAVLDPHLPDPRFGMALAAMKKGPLGVITAVQETVAGTSARLKTGRGACTSGTCSPRPGCSRCSSPSFVFALMMLLRHATLLRHDFEEDLGRGERSPSASRWPCSCCPPSPSRAGDGCRCGGWPSSSSICRPSRRGRRSSPSWPPSPSGRW